MPTILLIDDEANIRRMLGALLRSEGFDVTEAANGTAALLAVDAVDPDAVFLDLMMPPGPDGLATLATLRERGVDAPVIMMSGKAQLSDAVRATQLGAFQFLEKPLSPESALVTLRAALELRRTQMENRTLRAALTVDGELVGSSQVLVEVRSLVAQVAPTDARVLITGESGTGKELVALAIHRAGRRSRRAFIPVNCAAIPRDLVESELFGHEKGAFTGATDRRLGRFSLADRGTIFLDEVGDLHPEAQAKLLRVLETGELQRLGAERSERVDVRVLAATNRRLDQAVANGGFREDLFFRLNVFPIELPPLRARAGDVPELVAHFTRKLRPRQPPRFSAEALEALRQYAWPGNVRELANVVERLLILGGGGAEIGLEAVLQVIPAGRAPGGPASAGAGAGGIPLAQSLDAYEREVISHAIARADGNVAEAARQLRTDRANLYRRMRRLGLQ
ncbi:MAG TPA: sigma-54 dependent transcriptional regulator [Gemmatimonadales bacterium]|nr:sigma-54 dependent transcriptional regulator [Gemmatimonadales bacterium]